MTVDIKFKAILSQCCLHNPDQNKHSINFMSVTPYTGFHTVPKI